MRGAWVVVGLCACGRLDFTAQRTADGGGDAPHAGYAYRKPITLDHTKALADLVDFPLVIVIPATDLQLQTGHDLAFFAADGTTPLPFELDTSDPANLVAWVKLPALSASVDTQLYIAFGDPNVTTSQEAAHAVWSDYAGVWHFSESIYQGVAGEAADATGAHSGTAFGSTSPIAGGVFGRTAHFVGSCDNISIDASPALQPPSVTVSAWARPQDLGMGSDRIDTILAQDYWRAPGTSSQGYYLELYRSVSDPETTFYAADGPEIAHAFAGNLASNGAWLYAVGTYDATSGTSTIYVNGMPLGRTTMTGPIAYLNNPVKIGCSQSADWWSGDIDEVHIAAGARSAGWIATEYNNQLAAATFASVGATEDSP
jgi:hypothetical protein